MIYLITDIGPNGEDILTPNKTRVLYIRDLDDNYITEVHPIKPWTHKTLTEVVDILYWQELDTDVHGFNSDGKAFTLGGSGADAFLGTKWIGSSEC